MSGDCVASELRREGLLVSGVVVGPRLWIGVERCWTTLAVHDSRACGWARAVHARHVLADRMFVHAGYRAARARLLLRRSS